MTWRRRKIKISGILGFWGVFVREWLVWWGGFSAHRGVAQTCGWSECNCWLARWPVQLRSCGGTMHQRPASLNNLQTRSLINISQVEHQKYSSLTSVQHQSHLDKPLSHQTVAPGQSVLACL